MFFGIAGEKDGLEDPSRRGKQVHCPLHCPVSKGVWALGLQRTPMAEKTKAMRCSSLSFSCPSGCIMRLQHFWKRRGRDGAAKKSRGSRMEMKDGSHLHNEAHVSR